MTSFQNWRTQLLQFLFKFSYVELIFYSVPTSTKKSLAVVSTELKARNKSGTKHTY
jgi:hypothetical protein